MSGAAAAAMSAFVLAGLPVTVMRMPSAACSWIARPCAAKIAPFAASRSARSIPFERGLAPTSSACSAPSNATSASAVVSTDASRGKAASCSSITTPSSAGRACGTSRMRRRTGWSGPSMSPAAMRKSSW